MEFLNKEHENNFNLLVKKAKLGSADIEEKTMFYIIAGNRDLMNQVEKIYDFKENWLQDSEVNEDGERYFKGVLTSSGSKRLLNLATQLYNNFNEQSVLDTFSYLDKENRKLALNAIKLRFDF